MIDPLTVTVNVLSILQTCAYAIRAIDRLLEKYRNTPAKLIALQSESRLISSSLVTVQALFHKNDILAKNLDATPELKLTLDTTLTGCMAIYKLLDKDLQRLAIPGGYGFDWTEREYFQFNDALIEQYLRQSRGYLQGLNLLLNCLQLESVREIQAILHEQIFSQIAQENLSIRPKFKELDVPVSIYDDRTVEGEKKEFCFDDLVVNSKAYRDVMRAAHRHSSLQPGSTARLRARQDPLSSQTQQNTSDYINDLLSDLPVSTLPDELYCENSFLGPPPAPTDDPEENLIDLSDPDPQPLIMSQAQRHSVPVPSLHMQDLMDIVWNQPQPVQPVEQIQPVQSAEEIQQIEPIQPAQPFQPTFRSFISEPPMESDRRDSERSHLRQSDIISYYPDDKIFIQPDNVEEKIVVEPPSEEKKIVIPPIAQSNRPDSISQASLRRASSIMSQGSVTRSPRHDSRELHPTDTISPRSELPSPLTPNTSYFGFRRSSGAEALVPPTDEVVEEKLLDEMQACLAANDLMIQLDWAEEALRYCRMCSDFETRVSKTQHARASVPDGEEKLRKMAMQVVEGAATAGNGRAMFIKGRLVEKNPSAVTKYLEAARRAGYHRSHYWIGKQCLAEKDSTALWHFETGVKYGDQACQFALGKILLEGSLGWKKHTTDEAKGRDLINQSAVSADKDCPDALYYLATHQSAKPSKSAPFRFSHRSPIPPNPSAALSNFQRAALLGHSPSMVRLGLAHRSGNLSGSGGGGGGAKQQVTSDPGLALHYLSLAARRGNAEADYEIANTLFWGVESKDALVKYGRQAYVHARRAAEDGWTAAFLLVGMAYEDGVGVEKSERTAANWYLQGCSKGDEFARKKYDHLVYRGVEAFRKH